MGQFDTRPAVRASRDDDARLTAYALSSVSKLFQSSGMHDTSIGHGQPVKSSMSHPF
jgi:hypothetical protein